jgi:hypothetical protein
MDWIGWQHGRLTGLNGQKMMGKLKTGCFDVDGCDWVKLRSSRRKGDGGWRHKSLWWIAPAGGRSCCALGSICDTMHVQYAFGR